MASAQEYNPNLDRSTRFEWIALSITVLVALLLLTFRAVSEGINERGDGIQHYMIARYSWAHPRLFVDHWGKPLFTLLSSPFAQLGYAGMVCFNAVLAIITSYLAIRLLRKTGGVAQIAFPVLMLLSPQYVLVIMNGMTEVLFGLLSVVTVYLLYREKYWMAAMIASFSPFARPEYALFLPMVALWLAWCGQWKAIPLLVVGFTVYGLVGWWLVSDPLWYWHQDPYRLENDTYGAGDLYHFVDNAHRIFGQPLLMLGVLALVLWPILYWRLKENRKMLVLVVLLCALPVVATFALHSFIWWKGTFGSAGLLRVIATVVPLAVLFTVTVLVSAVTMIIPSTLYRTIVGIAGLIGLVGWGIVDLQAELEIPQHSTAEQRMLDVAGDDIKSRLNDKLRVHSTHPYIAYRAGLDQFDTLQYIAQYGYPSPEEIGWYARPGDILVWETQFGPNENQISIDRLLDDNTFEIVNVVCSNASYRSLGSPPQEVFILMKHNAVRSIVRDTVWSRSFAAPGLKPRIDSVTCAMPTTGRICLLHNEFPFEIRGLEVPSGKVLFDVINVEVDINWSGTSSEVPLLILSQEEFGGAVRYEPLPMQQGKFSIKYRLTPQLGNPTIVVYIYNLHKLDITINNFLVTRDRWTQERR